MRSIKFDQLGNKPATVQRPPLPRPSQEIAAESPIDALPQAAQPAPIATTMTAGAPKLAGR